jgi:hypothetical protein
MVTVEKILNLLFYTALSIFIIGIIFFSVSSMIEVGYILLIFSTIQLIILSIVSYTLKKKKKNMK